MQDPRARRWLIAMLAVLALLPILTTLMDWSGQILLRGLGIFVLLALGLNILLGVAGVLDLGYAISFALGGYAAAIITLRLNVDFIWVLLASAGLAGLFGLIRGAASLRLRGDYLAVATLALGLMAQQVIVSGGDLTGRALALLAAITGNIGRSGGGFSVYVGQYKVRVDVSSWWYPGGKKAKVCPSVYFVAGRTPTMHPDVPYPKQGWHGTGLAASTMEGFIWSIRES